MFKKLQYIFDVVFAHNKKQVTVDHKMFLKIFTVACWDKNNSNHAVFDFQDEKQILSYKWFPQKPPMEEICHRTIIATILGTSWSWFFGFMQKGSVVIFFKQNVFFILLWQPFNIEEMNQLSFHLVLTVVMCLMRKTCFISQLSEFSHSLSLIYLRKWCLQNCGLHTNT